MSENRCSRNKKNKKISTPSSTLGGWHIFGYACLEHKWKVDISAEGEHPQILWPVHCGVCTVECLLCSVHCLVCTVYYILWTGQCVVCTVNRALCSVHCERCTVECALWSVHRVSVFFRVCTVDSALWIVHCRVCNVKCYMQSVQGEVCRAIMMRSGRIYWIQSGRQYSSWSQNTPQ